MKEKIPTITELLWIFMNAIYSLLYSECTVIFHRKPAVKNMFNLEILRNFIDANAKDPPPPLYFHKKWIYTDRFI